MKLLVLQKRRPALRAAIFCALAEFCSGFCTAQTEDLAALSRKVKQLMSEGHFEEAIPICEQLVQAAPGNLGLVLNLGLAEEMAGHPAKSIPKFEEVLRADPVNVPALTSLASARLQLDQPRLAIAPLRKLLAVEPSNRNARGMLAEALIGVNQWGDASEEYRELASENASDAKAWYGLGKAYESLAARSFERLSKADPESPYAAALIAGSRFQRRQYRSAFFFYRQALEKMPDLRGIRAGLAMVYAATGHADWAETERGKENNLPAPDCATDPAECHYVQGQFLESARAADAGQTPSSLFWGAQAYNQLALDAFARLGALPESVELHALKAQIFHGHDQEIEAANEWRAALKLAPGNKRLESELARSLFLARDYNSTMPLVEKLLPGRDAPPDLNFMMGESLLRTEQPGRALPYLEAALRADPKMLSAHASLGSALTTLGRGVEAIPHLEKALPLDDDGSLHYQLARAYRQAGDNQRYRETMAQYQKIQKRNRDQNDELAKSTEITAPAER